MAEGTILKLESFNYPNPVPPGAYILWTLQMDNSSAFGDTVFRISFGRIRLNNDATLIIGSGWDPDDSQAVKASYWYYYNGYPDDLVLNHTQIFVEFDASHGYYDYYYYYYHEGFQLEIVLLNVSGKSNSFQNDHQQYSLPLYILNAR